MTTPQIAKELHPGVVLAFWEWLEGFEGDIPFMYLDNKGLVTIGRGLNINEESELRKVMDPSLFQPKPGVHLTVDKKQIREDWRHIKDIWRRDRAAAAAATIPDCRLTLDDRGRIRSTCEVHLKGKCAKATLLRLAPSGSLRAFWDKVIMSLSIVVKSPWFQHLDTFPADAQLAVLEFAWSAPGYLKNGAGLYSGLCRACQSFDFLTAAQESQRFATTDPGRKAGRRTMFLNAAFVLYDKIVNRSDRDVSALIFKLNNPARQLPPGQQKWKPPASWHPPAEWKAKGAKWKTESAAATAP